MLGQWTIEVHGGPFPCVDAPLGARTNLPVTGARERGPPFAVSAPRPTIESIIRSNTEGARDG
ncbi:hypothetical protein CZ771_10005 [Actinomycetales bacterium JB111]|nr:hypothetical protein CZ771_10005 [Actinomycetales bacterium JB111]